MGDPGGCRRGGPPSGVLVGRLRQRRGEIEQSIVARVGEIGDDAFGARSSKGLRVAVAAALEFGFEILEFDDGASLPIPPAVLHQARLAARRGISLETVLRQCFAGSALLGCFVLQEAGRHPIESGHGGAPDAFLRRLRGMKAHQVDRLVATVGEEYRRERKQQSHPPEQQKVRQVRRILAGEPVDTIDLGVSLDGWHIGMVAIGPGTQREVRDLAKAGGQRLLLIRPDAQTVWAWLSGRSRLDPSFLLGTCSKDKSASFSLAVGEPGFGLTGWRLTHRQALAAMRVAVRRRERIVRYTDVALLATAMQDEILAASLRATFIGPLMQGDDEGSRAMRTLQAYFAAGRNASSCAAALGVSRQTVNNRVRMAEERIGRPIETCAAELATALSLRELDQAESFS